jgi:hypothetical protein
MHWIVYFFVYSMAATFFGKQYHHHGATRFLLSYFNVSMVGGKSLTYGRTYVPACYAANCDCTLPKKYFFCFIPACSGHIDCPKRNHLKYSFQQWQICFLWEWLMLRKHVGIKRDPQILYFLLHEHRQLFIKISNYAAPVIVLFNKPALCDGEIFYS